jgi:hypothetical protein
MDLELGPVGVYDEAIGRDCRVRASDVLGGLLLEVAAGGSIEDMLIGVRAACGTCWDATEGATCPPALDL